jgi:hypothetical protein
LKDRSGDLKDDGIPNFIYDVSNLIVGFNVENNSSNYSSGKRKVRQHFIAQGEKKKVLK